MEHHDTPKFYRVSPKNPTSDNSSFTGQRADIGGTELEKRQGNSDRD